MSDIDKEIAKAKRNAQAKMARIKKSQRYDIASSTNNPIRSDIDSMTSRQKQSYLRQLKKFNDRSTKFYVDASGRPLSSRQWERYKQAEARANAFVRADIKKYAKLYGPEGNKGMTLGERMAIMRPKAGKLMVNPSGSSMHEIERKPTAVTGDKSVAKLIKSQIDKANPAKQVKKLRTGRKQLEEMATAFGDTAMVDLARELTDEQFKVLWNYTDFATAVSLEYSVYMQSLVDEKSFHAGAMENANRKAHEYLEWASQI
jgi:hypothetical protein